MIGGVEIAGRRIGKNDTAARRDWLLARYIYKRRQCRFIEQRLASGNARNQRHVIVSLSTLPDPIGRIGLVLLANLLSEPYRPIARTAEGVIYRIR